MTTYNFIINNEKSIQIEKWCDEKSSQLNLEKFLNWKRKPHSGEFSFDDGKMAMEFRLTWSNDIISYVEEQTEFEPDIIMYAFHNDYVIHENGDGTVEIRQDKEEVINYIMNRLNETH